VKRVNVAPVARRRLRASACAATAASPNLRGIWVRCRRRFLKRKSERVGPSMFPQAGPRIANGESALSSAPAELTGAMKMRRKSRKGRHGVG
jgi:hypothetical protein